MAENGIPLSFATDLLLQDTLSGTEIILVCTPSGKINSANTTATGLVESPGESTIYYEMDAMQLVDAVRSNKLSVVAQMQSPSQGIIPTIIRPGQEMIIRIGAEAKFK